MMKISGYQNPAAGLQQLMQKTAIDNSSSAEKAGKTSHAVRVDDAVKSFASELSSASESSRSAQTTADVKFSKHAAKRMHSRNISLSPSQMQQLSEAMDKAQAKGARETLVLTDDAAFVIATDNRMVISAFDKNSLREGVFTKIDSAVIL
ncbi:hypothetical protein JYT16_00930 [Gemmatimonas aurantiaca]|nr:hypothetical protein [Gemmatimonas aurantiaca]